MRIIKGLFLGILVGFVAGCCLREHCPVIERSQNTISSGAAWAILSPATKSEALSTLTSHISADIAAGNYKKPYEYLRNRWAGGSIDNTLVFFWRYTRFTDGDRRDFLEVYLKKLHEAGHDDWIGKIHVREREDYYNAILARLRCLYIMLETLHTQGRDDVFFLQVWREFDFLGRRLDNLLGRDGASSRNVVLGFSVKERASMWLNPMILPVPEFLPTWAEKMRLE